MRNLSVVLCIGSSQAGPVQSGTAWSSTNFALGQINDIFNDAVDAINSVECPDDLTGIVQTVCALFKNTLYLVLKTIYVVFRTVSNVKNAAFVCLFSPSHFSDVHPNVYQFLWFRLSPFQNSRPQKYPSSGTSSILKSTKALELFSGT